MENLENVYIKSLLSKNDSFGSKIKLFSILIIEGIIPLCTATFLGRKYYKYFEQAIKYSRSK